MVDGALVRRVEWSAARLATLQAEALRQFNPESGATAVEFDGGALVAFGPGRYVNRAIGVGLGTRSPAEVVDAVRGFYEPRDQAPSFELCPWVAHETVQLLAAAGFVPDWFRNVYVHPLDDLPEQSGVGLETVSSAGVAERIAILAQGALPGSAARSISDEFCGALELLPNKLDFVAVADGHAAACGSLTQVDGIAWLGGAATLPSHQGRGLQTALIARRLHSAAAQGCEYAAVTALVGGASARNLLRVGFQLMYTQVVLTRAS